MDAIKYHEWLENRDNYRSILYGEKAGTMPATDGMIETSSLAGLAHAAYMRGRQGNIEKVQRSEVHEAVTNIIDYHDELASRDQAAIYAHTDPAYRKQTIELTAEVICRWERACRREQQVSPFAELPIYDIADSDFERQDVQLVIETATAINEILGLGYMGSYDADEQKKKLIQFMTFNGPAFAASWKSGLILRDYCLANGLDPENYLEHLTQEKLISLAVHNHRDPLNATIRYIRNREIISDTEVLASRLQWDRARTESVFPPGLRNEIARLSDPLGKAVRIARTIETVLTTENIADALEVPVDDAEGVFSPVQLARFAFDRDPLAKIRRVGENLRLLGDLDMLSSKLGLRKEDIGFISPGELRTIAINNVDTDSCLRVVRLVCDNFHKVLTTANIASVLNWSEIQVDSLFTESVRKRIALGNKMDPLGRVSEIASNRSLLIRKYGQLPIEVIDFISSNWSKNCESVAETVVREAVTCPPGISERAWMWRVASNPNSSREALIRELAKFKAFMDLRYALSLDSDRLQGDKSLHHYVAASHADPADLLTALEPSDFLLDLAQKANVSYEALVELLKVYQENGGHESAELTEVMNMLRSAAT